jgi:putative transcriptional regulator
MTKIENLTGKIIIAQPAFYSGHFSKSIVLIAQHGEGGSWGVVLNRLARTVTMKEVMKAAGVEYHRDEAIYIGGPVEPTRIHVVHSLDWSSSGTMCINDEIGITGDLSILAAISAGEGPDYYRAGIGLAVWSAGQLDGEMKGQSPWKPEQRWLTTDATVNLCFNELGEEQWHNAIGHCIEERVSDLF